MELEIDTEIENSDSEIVATLERILSHSDFLAAPRLSSFLRFVVTETLAGRADRLKAFTIASMALGHDEKFNPKTNSIVRVQAGRLRRLLESYYEGPGRFDRCEIRLSRGSYAPEFVFRSKDDLPQQPSQSAPNPVTEPVRRRRGLRPLDVTKRLGRLNYDPFFAAILFAATAMLGLGLWIWHSSSETELVAGTNVALSVEDGWAASGATITVDPIKGFADDPAIRSFTRVLESRLEDALSRFDNPIVLHGTALARPLSDLDYHLSGLVTQAAGKNISLAFRIWNSASGQIIWARTFDEIHLDKTDAAFDPTISALTSAVAQTYGVVFTDMRKRLSGVSNGFGCVILASNYFKTPSAAAHASARECLERAVAQYPDFAPGFAALSYLMVDSYLNGIDTRPGEKPLEKAIEMANRAVDLSPQKARAHAAIFLTRFFDKRFKDAFAAADRALQLNPYATDTTARIGFAHVLRGEFDSGIALLQRAVRFSPSTPGWYQFAFFLDAHTRGDEHSAYRHAVRRAATRFPLGIVARIIVAHERGDAAAVAQWTQRLFTEYPVFAADVPAAFDRYAMAPEIRNRLISDLKEAGFPLQGQ